MMITNFKLDMANEGKNKICLVHELMVSPKKRKVFLDNLYYSGIVPSELDNLRLVRISSGGKDKIGFISSICIKSLKTNQLLHLQISTRDNSTFYLDAKSGWGSSIEIVRRYYKVKIDSNAIADLPIGLPREWGENSRPIGSGVLKD